MTENEAEVLGNMISAERYDKESGHDRGGQRPLDFGGSSNSHHAQTAIRMVPKGWVERSFGSGWGKPKRNMERGSCRYRTTEQGRAAYANHCAQLVAASPKAAADAAAPKP